MGARKTDKELTHPRSLYTNPCKDQSWMTKCLETLELVSAEAYFAVHGFSGPNVSMKLKSVYLLVVPLLSSSSNVP